MNLTMLLTGTKDGFVYVRGPNGEHLKGRTTLDRALRFVEEGLATILSPNTIQIHWLEREFRRYILERDNWTCHYCGKPGDTIDHLLPTSRGGLTTPANCVCACRTCNKEKDNLTEEEFLAKRQQQSKLDVSKLQQGVRGEQLTGQ